MNKRDNSPPIFDYRALRLIVGIFAFGLAPIVIIISNEKLTSISESYYTDARDIFVGLLFFISAFLWAYNGHSKKEKIASKMAAVFASGVALFPMDPPTLCTVQDMKPSLTAIAHYTSAVGMFSILAYFCLFPFRENVKGKSGKKGLRSKIYFACGVLIIASITGYGLLRWVILSECQASDIRLLFWAETVALIAFGIAWLVAGKYIRFLVDKEDALTLFK